MRVRRCAQCLGKVGIESGIDTDFEPTPYSTFTCQWCGHQIMLTGRSTRDAIFVYNRHRFAAFHIGLTLRRIFGGKMPQSY